MAGVSSLLKSAQSRQQKIQEQQDALASYEYSQSAKTYDDFVTYQNYLNSKKTTTTDFSKALTYEKDIQSARSGYVSNEIQRQTINVIEGRSTNTQKYNQMTNLFYSAIDSGQYDLAQSLQLQLDNLSVTIQNEAESAQRAANTLAMNGVKTIGQLVKKVKDGTDFIELPDGQVIKPLAMLGGELKGDKTANYFGESLRTIQLLQQVVSDAYSGASTQEAVDTLEEKYGDILTGTATFKTAAGSLSMQDIELAYRSELANNPIYNVETVRNETTGQTEYKLRKNKIDDFAWIRDDNGNYQAVQTRATVTSPNQTLSTQISNDGSILGTGKNGEAVSINAGTGKLKRDESLSIGNRLANQGIKATQASDGTLDLILPSGESVKGAIQPDGSVRYFGEPGQYSGGSAGMYQIDIFTGKTREVAPDESSDFGQQSIFGGMLSKASAEGKSYLNKYYGNPTMARSIDVPNAKISTLNDFSGTGLGVTSNLLQSAQFTQKTIADQQARATALQQVAQAQNANINNLNTTPVRQFASNGQPVKQLTVAAPQAYTGTVVQAPKQTITSVGVAKPSGNIKLGNSGSGSIRLQ